MECIANSNQETIITTKGMDRTREGATSIEVVTTTEVVAEEEAEEASTKDKVNQDNTLTMVSSKTTWVKSNNMAVTT